MATARFIHDSSDKNADLYYATKFRAPDPFIFLEARGKKILVMNDLEIDRAKKQAEVDEVWSLTMFAKRAVAKNKQANAAEILGEIFKQARVKNLVVPVSTSFVTVDELRKRGYTITHGTTPFYAERLIKTREEIKHITASQRTVFATIRMVEEALRASSVKNGTLYYRGAVLTSERVRTMINMFLMERSFMAADTIVSCGRHSIDPHDEGSGPLKANAAIIVDIYPKSMKTLYYGDATRTFCKGRAPEALKRLYATVLEGQKLGIKLLKGGINGRDVHKRIMDYFTARGYATGEKGGRMQGFFHSTGHGIGLELHESPTRVGPLDMTMEAGYVVSVEPGLYYKDIGGVRIEDLVHITKSGCEVLAGYPKKLEID